MFGKNLSIVQMSDVESDLDEPDEFTPEEESGLTLVRDIAVETEESYAPVIERLSEPTAGSKSAEILAPVVEDTAATPPVVQESVPPTKPPHAPIEIKPSDFLFGTTLGEGAYARVVHCRLKSMQKDYAMKILEKAHIKKEKKVACVLMEKDILIRFSHPMIIKLYYCFTDAYYIYMCMDLAPGGELSNVIAHAKRNSKEGGVACDAPTCQFYIAELIEALEYLHANNIVHKDLKPENVLLTAEGHIKLADFGAAVLGEEKESSFDGTALYVSPEVLNSAPATGACDLWALGCILYQMMTGKTPFSGDTEYLIFRNIQRYVEGTYVLNFPDFMTEEAKSLISGLLHPDALQRLGAGVDDPNSVENSNGYGTLKGHPFFEGVAWGDLLHTTPPFTPSTDSSPNPEALSDGADDDWMFGGEATIISTHPRKVSIDKEAAGTSSKSSKEDNWKAFLMPNEQQVFSGLTSKRKGLFSKARRLVLTDMPRLFYVDPDSMEMKGEVPWEAQFPVRCTIVDEFKFDVLATKTNRVYHLLDKEVGSQVWVDLINAMVEKQAIEYKMML